MKKYLITIDLGGTKILSALLNDKNEIIGKVKQPTDATKGADFIVECIVESINKLFEKYDITEKNIKAIWKLFLMNIYLDGIILLFLF